MAISRFQSILAAALAEFGRYGYDSKARLEYWQARLRLAASQILSNRDDDYRAARKALEQAYKRAITLTALGRHHPGLRRYAIERVGGRLAPLLERRILASVDLIRLNRAQSVEKVLQRFSGLVTSIPEGGSRAIKYGAAKKEISKSLRQMSFEERRVVIDQGHKLVSVIQRTIAEDGGAIAAIWHSHWRQPGYDYREDHKERDNNVYAIRDNWAIRDGLMKAGPAGYVDEITQPAEEPFCRCAYTYVYNIRDLPPDMLTRKGQAQVARKSA